MALFTQFLQKQHRAEQALRAGGRSNLSNDELATIMAPVTAMAEAEEEGRAAEDIRAKRAEDISARHKRFKEELGVSREDLALAKKRSVLGREVAAGELGLKKHDYRHAKSMKPWVVGLGLAEIGVAAREYGLQRKRDAAVRRMWERLLTQNGPSKSSKSGHILRRGGITYT